LAEADEAYKTWRNLYLLYQKDFEEFSDMRPREIQDMLRGYAVCGRFMNQRLLNLVCQHMEFLNESSEYILRKLTSGGCIFAELFFNLSFGGVLSHALDAIFTGGLGGVAFGGGNDLTIAGLQTETELTGLVNVHFELGIDGGFKAFCGLILEIGDGCILLDTLNALQAGCLAS